MGDFGDIGKSRQFVSIIYYLKLIFWQMNGTVITKVKGKIFFNKKNKRQTHYENAKLFFIG